MPAKKVTKKPAAKAKTTRSTKARAPKKPAFTLRNVALAQLGVYSAVFETVQDQVELAQKKAPGYFNTLVKRGEKAQKELSKEVKKARKEFTADTAQARGKFEDMVDNVRSTVGA